MSAYPKNIIRVLQKPSVKIPSVPTGVVVSLDTVVMERCAQTLMNAALGVHNCSYHGHCNNTIGSYLCRCAEGFHGNGMSCEDVDECNLVNMHNCSVRAHCVNTIVLMIVLVFKDFMEMACPVRTQMNAKTTCTFAVFMHTAITVLALMTVLASQATQEMDVIVTVRTRRKVSLLSCPQLVSYMIYVNKYVPSVKCQASANN